MSKLVLEKKQGKLHIRANDNAGFQEALSGYLKAYVFGIFPSDWTEQFTKFPIEYISYEGGKVCFAFCFRGSFVNLVKRLSSDYQNELRNYS